MTNAISLSLFASESLAKPKITWKNWGLDAAFTLASYLYDPLLKVDQLRKQIHVLNKLHPNASKGELVARKVLYKVGIIVNGLVAIPVTVVGFAVRSVALYLQKNPFLHCKSDAREESFYDSFSLYSANICCPNGGYSISDAGILPWSYRINNLIKVIAAQDKQVVCLSEIFDIQTSHYLIAGLAKQYSHFYYCMGSNFLGPTSGLFVASKIKIFKPYFEFFSKKNLDGRSKWSNKGFFRFELHNQKGESVIVYTTHMGHSEIPVNPTSAEINARRRQRQQIMNQMSKFEEPQILTGDLNLDTEEFFKNDWGKYFDSCVIPNCDFTWGGDEFCAKYFADKTASPPSTLDYTMVYVPKSHDDRKSKTTKVAISTEYVSNGFEGSDFNIKALSDHKTLCSRIVFEKK